MNSFQITISDTIIKNGLIIPFDKSQSRPDIKFNKSPDEYYTIIMVDPDAPSRQNPINKYWLHLLIVNNNSEIVKFEPPSPPTGSGNHRYVFFLLKQSGVLHGSKLKSVNGRKNFNVREFIANNNLKVIDSVYFVTSSEK